MHWPFSILHQSSEGQEGRVQLLQKNTSFWVSSVLSCVSLLLEHACHWHAITSFSFRLRTSLGRWSPGSFPLALMPLWRGAICSEMFKHHLKLATQSHAAALSLHPQAFTLLNSVRPGVLTDGATGVFLLSSSPHPAAVFSQSCLPFPPILSHKFSSPLFPATGTKAVGWIMWQVPVSAPIHLRSCICSVQKTLVACCGSCYHLAFSSDDMSLFFSERNQFLMIYIKFVLQKSSYYMSIPHPSAKNKQKIKNKKPQHFLSKHFQLQIFSSVV